MVCDTEKSYLPIEKENRLGEKKNQTILIHYYVNGLYKNGFFSFPSNFFFSFSSLTGVWTLEGFRKKKKRELKIVLCVFVCVALLETMLGVLEDRVCPVWYESQPLMTDTMKANPTHKHGAKSQEKKEKKKMYR